MGAGCMCDPSFSSFTGCHETACFTVNLTFCIAFCAASIGCACVIYHLFLGSRRAFELPKVIAYFNLAALLLRVVRFLMLFHPSINPSEDTGVVYALNAVYSATVVFGMLSYTVLSYSWMYIYHKVILKSERGEIPSRKEILRQPLFPIYFTLNALAYIGWVVLFSLNMDDTLGSYPQIFLSFVILNSCLFLFIYGLRITIKIRKQDKEIGSIRSGPSARFHRLKGICFAASAVLFVLVMFIGATQTVVIMAREKYYTIWFVLGRTMDGGRRSGSSERTQSHLSSSRTRA